MSKDQWKILVGGRSRYNCFKGLVNESIINKTDTPKPKKVA